MSESLVVDANPLISALLGGQAWDILYSQKFTFVSTQHTLFEVQKYVPHLAAKVRVREEELFKVFNLLPVIAHQPHVYDSHVEAAKALIESRDHKDIPILALVLKLSLPIWTDDQDFEELPGVTVVKTNELLARIRPVGS